MLDIDHRIFISGTGSYVPENVVTNEALEGLVGNYDEGSGRFSEWVDRVTHIRSRRFLDQDGSSGDLAREACRAAIEDAGIDPAEIGLFIMATFTTKNLYPGEQTMLVEELGMNGAATFYLTAGCAGSVYGMQVAAAFLRCGIYKHALIVGTEHLSSVVDFDDPITAILFADGAGAVVLSRRDEEGPGGMVDRCVLGSNYVPGNIMMQNTNVPPRAKCVTLNGAADGERRVAMREFLRMEGGPRVLRIAVNTMADATLESLGFTNRDLKDGNQELLGLLDRVKLVPHQANGRIVDGLQEKLGLREEQVYKTLYHYGNISCASNLITLDYGIRHGSMRRVLSETDSGVAKSIEEGVGPKIGPGDLVAIPTVGAGYLTGCFTYIHE